MLPRFDTSLPLEPPAPSGEPCAEVSLSGAELGKTPAAWSGVCAGGAFGGAISWVPAL